MIPVPGAVPVGQLRWIITIGVPVPGPHCLMRCYQWWCVGVGFRSPGVVLTVICYTTTTYSIP